MTRRGHQRGSVLIFTLWLSTGLAAAALLFGQAAMLRYRAAANELATRRCTQATEGALRYVIQVLTTAGTPGVLPDTTTYQSAALVIGDAQVWLIARGAEANATEPEYGLQDEAGRLNLNTATYEQLVLLPGMTTDLAANLVDWRSPTGASSAAYASMDPPYAPKAGPFETVEELRLVAGAEAELLTGRDRNRNGFVETWEREYVAPGTTIFSGTPDTGLLDQFTVSSSEPNTTPTGGPRVNVNGNPAAVRATLGTLFGASRGQAIAAAAGVGTTRFTSPLHLAILGKVTDAEAGQICNTFSLGGTATSTGLINVTTASADVLATVPGIGADLAATLVTYRAQTTGTFASPLWVATAIGNEAAITAAPFITAKSYQVTADIVAVDSHGRAFTRTRYVIDTTTGTPVVIARRDLTQLGWPLGQPLHDQLFGTPEDTSR